MKYLLFACSIATINFVASHTSSPGNSIEQVY